MAHEATLHLKLDRATAENLKRIAQSRKKSRGQLVREAIAACYQTEDMDLPKKQERALVAYRGGFISIGKLARVMGMHVLELRGWLHEHGVNQSNVYSDGEDLNA